MEELYESLGKSKCQELWQKRMSLWKMQGLDESGKSTQVSGAVLEGIAKDFFREFLPAGLGIKSGLVFNAQAKKMSPQIDGIIYLGVPLLEFTDVIVAEKEQVKAIFEIKAFIDQGTIFGRKIKDTKDREPKSGLASAFKRRKDFLPAKAKYILFAFSLSSSSPDAKVIEKLRSKEICDSYAIVLRLEPKKEQKPNIYNFDSSVSWLIEWLRNLS